MALECAHHTVFIHDRGGVTRIGEINPLSTIVWERVRDDISTCTIHTAGPDPACCEMLANSEPGRHELVVYRDSQRVWEGPITRMGFHRDEVEIEARDVLHYYYRLALSQSYDNRYIRRNAAKNCSHVTSVAALPAGFSYGNKGQCRIVDSNGHMYVWTCGDPAPTNCRWKNTGTSPTQPAGCSQVSTYAALPVNFGPGNTNQCFWTTDTHTIYTWICQDPDGAVNCSWVDKGPVPGGGYHIEDNVDTVLHRMRDILEYEGNRIEDLTPPANVVPHLVFHDQPNDVRTSRLTLPYQMTVWEHLDAMAHRGGIDYTAVGRSIHLWDNHVVIARTPQVSESDFLGEVIVSVYGMDLATAAIVTDGEGHWGSAGGTDPYYGRIELLATAFDESEGGEPPTSAEMRAQAQRNLSGRLPTPLEVRVPDGSQLNPKGALTIDDLVPGARIPLVATMTCRTVSQMQVLNKVQVQETPDGEAITVTLTPASVHDIDLEDV
jgi:hypothetical protein